MIGDLWALSRRAKAPHVLVIDDFVPGTRAEARMPRAAELLRALAAAGAQLTVLPIRDQALEDMQGYAALRLRAGDDLGRVLATRTSTFAAIFVSRANNMTMVAELLARDRSVIGDALIVYDAEMPPAARPESLQADELASARRADIVLALDAATAAEFKDAGHPDARVLGCAVAPQPSPPFGRRRGILAVGPTYGDPASIAAGVAWFAEHVQPLLRKQLGTSVSLTVAGEDVSPLDVRRSDRTIVPLALGTQPPPFERARVFVALQMAGGLPLNIYDAAAHGVPAVLVPALARRTGWSHGGEVLVAESAEEFAAACIELNRDQLLWEGMSASARLRVSQECDRTRFDAVIREVLAQAVSTRR